MQLIWTSCKKNKYKLLFLSSLFLIGVIAGIIYYTGQSGEVKEVLKSSMTFDGSRVNMLVGHLLVLPCLMVLLFILIGVPICLFYLFYEGLSLGFTLMVMISSYKFKGLLLMFKYLIFFKIGYIVLLILFSLKMIDCGRNLIGLLIYKNEQKIRKNFINNLKKLGLFFIFLLIYDGIIYLISPFLLRQIITF